MALSFIPLGIGDAFTALHYTSCLLVESGGARILVDCPHPIRKMLRDGTGATIDADAIDAIVVTHLHADHSSGLEGFGYFSHFALHRKAKLLAHPAVAARLWDGHLAAGMESLMSPSSMHVAPRSFADFFELVPLDEAVAVAVGPFSIECRRTVHHIPTTALRIRAGGRTLGLSSDTAFDPGLIEWLADSDLVVHETNFGVHTPYEKLAALDPSLRAKMRITHAPDYFESDAIEMLRQGRRYEV